MKEEQWKIQQDMLKRRKDKGKMKEYFAKVEKAREYQSRKARASLWSRSKDSEDPLEKWKASKKRGEIKPLGYEASPSKSDSKLGVNVVIPLNPIGMPKYDNGERFDLRLPYAERGYEDPDADVMGKMFGGLFGGSRKPAASTKSTTTSSKKRNEAEPKKKGKFWR